MNNFFKLQGLAGVLILILVSCQSDDNTTQPEIIDPITDTIIVEDQVTVNPTGYAPLSAIISLKTREKVSVSAKITGKNGEDSDVTQSFEELKTEFEIPIHGLYGNFENTVVLSFSDSNGNSLGNKTYQIQTTSLISDLPDIRIDKSERNQMAEGMTLVNYYGYYENTLPFRPFMFDSYGNIRWYLNFKDHPTLQNLHYDNGPHRLQNGNLYFAKRDPDMIFEVDLFGKVIDSWSIPGYRFHHEVLEKPNGNFLVLVDKYGEPTIEDYVIEIDRNSKEIINIWNLNESLDNTRTTLTENTEDWIHVNGISYDDSDDTIIISGRTQGVIKLTASNEVVWIMGSHKDWKSSGNNIDLNQFLLQPLDQTGVAITDQGVLDGDINHTDFEWNWYQHAPKILPNGNIILFDNGDNRNFTGNGPYSRAVAYKIDEEKMTIQQVWQYGKERGDETYSRIVSDVDYLQAKNHILFSPGSILSGPQPVGKSIEIDMESGQVIFEATITPPKAFVSRITFHRTERLSLYP